MAREPWVMVLLWEPDGNSDYVHMVTHRLHQIRSIVFLPEVDFYEHTADQKNSRFNGFDWGHAWGVHGPRHDNFGGNNARRELNRLFPS